MAIRGTPPKGSIRRDEVAAVLRNYGRSLHKSEIMSKLGLDVDRSLALSRILDDLVFDGSVVALPGQRFRASASGKASAPQETEGVLHANARGFGFVSAEGGDIFVRRDNLRGALHGDRVIARVLHESAKGREGTIVSVVSRRAGRLAGQVRKRRGRCFIEPDDPRQPNSITTASDDPLAKQAPDGSAVVFELLGYSNNPDEPPEGRIVTILGEPGTLAVEVKKILILAAIEEEHPALATSEAESYGTEVSQDALAGRRDLTSIPLPTIDPIDARDHDDAIWAVRHADGSYTATIAIADVSQYVTPGTALDQAAFGRGCSIYLPDRAIPMLPRALSSTLCSLLPGVTRLCMALEIDLEADGSLRQARFFEAFMRSRAKLNYEGVAHALGYSSEAPRQPEAEQMRQELLVLADLASILRARRMRRGALDLQAPEAKVVLDEVTGLPVDAVRRGRDPGVAKAYQIVEEFMLLANETVAQRLLAAGVPTVFRNHEVPEPEKLEKFSTLCKKVSLPFEEDAGTSPKALSRLIKRINAHAQRELLHQQLIRSMKQAFYGIENRGHFGLASDAYLHFTSPIRRYPDLLVHRTLKSVIRAQKTAKNQTTAETLRAAAETSSLRERRAMDVERDVLDLYRALLMKDRLGETFAGTVSAIVGTGLFITIDQPYLDVMVRSESLGGDGFVTDDDGLSMTSRSGERIALGDGMLVTIQDVSIERRLITASRVVGERNGSSARGQSGRTQARGRRVRDQAADQKREPKKHRGTLTRAKPSPKKRRKG